MKSSKKVNIAILGLGRMGMQIARRLHKNGYKVVAWNRSVEPLKSFKNYGGVAANTVAEAMGLLPKPKIIWVMLPSGKVTDEMILGKSGIYPYLSSGDIVIDGGNAFYADSMRRAKVLQKKSVHFFDSGTSGGVWGEKNGFALMVGGPAPLWPKVEPIFKSLAAGNGESYGLVGPSGAGHFVKMVHNGIEYGMMEAIAEGYSLINKWNRRVDLAQVTRIWQKGSVVRSWLVDLCRDIFEKEDFSKVIGFVQRTGEGDWTVKTAKIFGVDVRVIRASLDVRKESEKLKNQKLFRNKLLALMRQRFGGHKVLQKK